MIEVTDHICERYIKRFNTHLQSITDKEEQLAAAKKAVEAIFKDAIYVGNNNEGVLLRSDTFGAYIVVNCGVLITIYPVDKKIKHREKKQSGDRNENQN